MTGRSPEERDAQAQAMVEQYRALLRAVPEDQRSTEPSPKHASPLGLTDDGRPLPGTRMPFEGPDDECGGRADAR